MRTKTYALANRVTYPNGVVVDLDLHEIHHGGEIESLSAKRDLRYRHQ